jgi:hypothetical protein
MAVIGETIRRNWIIAQQNISRHQAGCVLVITKSIACARGMGDVYVA